MLTIRTNLRPTPSSGLACSTDVIRTQQHFKMECDLMTILRKYQATGVLPVAHKEGVYADVSSITDYQSALRYIETAQADFQNQPSTIRDRFLNSPAALLQFLEDPSNRDEAIALGLIEQPQPAVIPQQKVVQTTPAADAAD